MRPCLIQLIQAHFPSIAKSHALYPIEGVCAFDQATWPNSLLQIDRQAWKNIILKYFRGKNILKNNNYLVIWV